MAAGAPEGELETPDAPKPSRAERRAEDKRRKESEKEAPCGAKAPGERAACTQTETGHVRPASEAASSDLSDLLLGRAEESPVARP